MGQEWRKKHSALAFSLPHPSKGRRPLGEAWLRVGAIIAEFNISGYGVAVLSASAAQRVLTADALSQRATP